MFFGSDNQSCASQVVLDAIINANQGFTHGYGDDQYTQEAMAQLEAVFECPLNVFFVATGTAANCLSLAALVKPWQTILCHQHAHVFMDESTAPEWFTSGARMVGIAQTHNKLSAKVLEQYLVQAGDDLPHNPQVGAVTITQANELGQVYSVEEIQSISQVCKSHNIKLHMDGARFANAVAALNCSPADITWKAGVDILSLGATKSGALCAEAIVVFNPDVKDTLMHLRKRSGHLISKGRLFGAQFSAWLKDQHWLTLAIHANAQASQLVKQLKSCTNVDVIFPVPANEIFMLLPTALAQYLRENGAEFYDWYPQTLPENIQHTENQSYVRLVTSFLTTDEHIENFITTIQAYQQT